jgi:hypothetical protein
MQQHLRIKEIKEPQLGVSGPNGLLFQSLVDEKSKNLRTGELWTFDDHYIKMKSVQ